MRAGLDTAMKVGQRKLFVGAVRVIVVQPPAEQERIDAKLLLEVRHNRNRPALAHENRLFSKALLDRLLGRRDIGTVERNNDARRTVRNANFQFNAWRTMFKQKLLHRRRDSIRILFWHQAKTDISARAGLDGRLEYLLPTPKAQNVVCRTRPA